MKTKGRRKSKNVVDSRSPAANALNSNHSERGFPASAVNRKGYAYVPMKSKDVYTAKHPDVVAKGPFKRMVEGMDSKKTKRKKGKK